MESKAELQKKLYESMIKPKVRLLHSVCLSSCDHVPGDSWIPANNT